MLRVPHCCDRERGAIETVLRRAAGFCAPNASPAAAYIPAPALCIKRSPRRGLSPYLA